MVNLEGSIEAVKAHLAEGSARSLTYAALECRIAIERICYERLKVSHDYISHDDLRRWQPHHVIRILSEEVDPHVAETYTISISPTPVSEERPPQTAEDYEALEYVEIGTHVGFNAAKLAKLWNALSRVALHVHLPEHKADHIPAYGDPEKIRKQVTECLAEIERISTGSLISSGLGEEVSFECACGSKNKRRARLLQPGTVLSCINPDCVETYEVTKEGEDFMFGRRAITVPCECGREHEIPTSKLEGLAKREMLQFVCECGETIYLHWKLFHSKKAASPVDS